jgi:transcriptional regulator with XRE-family HTH domain
MPSAALRHYLRQLRLARRVSQKALAGAMGLSLRALLDWEMGKTEDLKSSALVKAVAHLQASITDASTLLLAPDATEQDVSERVEQLLKQQRYDEFIGATGHIETVQLFGKLLQATQRDLAAVPLPDIAVRAGGHLYEGHCEVQGRGAFVLLDGQLLADVLEQTLGFRPGDLDWGYRGSRPHQLARAVLTVEYGVAIADAYSERFLFDVIAVLPRGQGDVEWVMEAEQVVLWLKLVHLIEQVTQHQECGVS